MKNNKKRGFTIVELVIVIAVIAILAAVLIPTFSNVVTNANKSKALQAARNAWTDEMSKKTGDEIGTFVAAEVYFEVDGQYIVHYSQTTGFENVDTIPAGKPYYAVTSGALSATTATIAGA